MNIKTGSIAKHYKKGNKYKILCIARNAGNESNPNKRCVIYQSMYHDKEYGDDVIWSRPLDEFCEILENGNKRFVIID